MAKEYKLLKNYYKNKRNGYRSAALKILENFECKKCGECYQYLIHITKNEAKKISKFTNLPTRKFVIAEGPYLFMYPCPFYSNDQKLCSIYPIRPLSCRMFPFHREENILLEVDHCPLSREIYAYINNRQEILKKLSAKYVDIELEKSVWDTLKRLEGLEDPDIDESLEKGNMLEILSSLRDLYNIVGLSVNLGKVRAINSASRSVETKYGEKRRKQPCKNFMYPIELLEAMVELLKQENEIPEKRL